VQAIDLVGRTFGRWTVKGLATKRGGFVWCDCECGQSGKIRREKLVSGQTKSCGCLRRELTSARTTTHGQSKPNRKTREYQTWDRMRRRCNNPKFPGYSDYGGRGIAVCERWSSFENFFEDMGPRPSDNHSLDRIDVNGDYGPGNCRWATFQEQMLNKRNTLYVVVGGIKRPLKEVTRERGLNYYTVWSRIKEHGYSVERALEIKPGA
jgi:hypothetical protein